jgi:hypothetical protein
MSTSLQGRSGRRDCQLAATYIAYAYCYLSISVSGSGSVSVILFSPPLAINSGG